MTQDTPPTAQRADARRNRQRLLEVADEMFRAGGIDASLDEIARRAGLGIGTLYRHFPTRDALVFALVAEDLGRVATFADELSATPVSVDEIARWADQLVVHDLTYRGLAEALIAATGTSSPLGAACARVHDAASALIRRAQDDGAIRTDIEPGDVIDAVGAVAWLTESDDEDRRRARLLRVLLDGLRAPGPAPRR